MSRKRIYIAYNGGTIGMRRSPLGYQPEAGYLQQLMRAMPVFEQDGMPDFVVHEYPLLLDSANMHPDDWLAIAEDIASHYDHYDGFIVLHGTDTLAYTASALPFMLQGLRKPVILTGSQIPLCEIRNDARDNLITSLLIAANYVIPEVCLFFGGRLLRGCRAVKVDARGFQAFDSPNYPHLGQAGIEIDIHREAVRPLPLTPPRLHVQASNQAVVATLRLFPGISAAVLDNMLQPPLQGLVLEAYGLGNGPARDPDFLRVLEQATARGVVIVAVTQCLKGGVELSSYATGQALLAAGVSDGGDMTTEAALAKLYYLFTTGYSAEQIRALMGVSLCGELTERV
jgi:L-asparaginase